MIRQKIGTHIVVGLVMKMVITAVVLAGCGVALVEDPQALPFNSVPSTTIGSGIINEDNPTVNVYFLNRGRLRAVPRPISVDQSAGDIDVVEKALRELLAGPTPQEQTLGYTSAMESIAPSGGRKPIVARISRGQVIIDVSTDLTGPTGDNVNAALGQLVYTVINSTSGIGSVVLTFDQTIIAGIRTDSGVSQGDLFLEDFQCLAGSGDLPCSSTEVNRAVITTNMVIEGENPPEVTGFYVTVLCSAATPSQQLLQFSASGASSDTSPVVAAGVGNECSFTVESVVGSDIRNLPDTQVRVTSGERPAAVVSLGEASTGVPVLVDTDVQLTVQWPGGKQTSVTTSVTTTVAN